jgi:hypothetical protein
LVAIWLHDASKKIARAGQCESARIVVEGEFFRLANPKFDFKSIKLIYCNLFSNQQEQK